MIVPAWRTACLLPAAALLVAACAGTAPERGQAARATGKASAQLAPAAAGMATVRSTARTPRMIPVPKRGGGYYKDDGPAEEIPDNLDETPDAEPRLEALHRFANRPYVALGRTYIPNTELQALRERGIASWYGRKFHGQRTSIGEPYDMFAMTAAHPTLAIPSYARVTSTTNGRSVIVRVIDRGPFHAGRVIDLSYAAAWKLGIVDAGSGPVEVEAIVPLEGGFPSSPVLLASAETGERTRLSDGGSGGTGPAPAFGETDELTELVMRLAASEATPASGNASARGVFLQLGAFTSADNAESLRNHLQRDLDWVSEPLRVVAGNGIHRVHLGPYASRADAEKSAERIRVALGFKPTLVGQSR